MKRILFAAAVLQLALTARPLLGVIEYLRSRPSFADQRAAILTLFAVVE